MRKRAASSTTSTSVVKASDYRLARFACDGRRDLRFFSSNLSLKLAYHPNRSTNASFSPRSLRHVRPRHRRLNFASVAHSTRAELASRRIHRRNLARRDLNLCDHDESVKRNLVCLARRNSPWRTLVLHPHQIQSAGRRRRPRRRPVPRLQYPRHILNLQCSLAHENKRAHQISHHVVQKTRAPNRIDEFASQPFPVEEKIRRIFDPGAFSPPRASRSFSKSGAIPALRSGSTAANEVKSCSPSTRARRPRHRRFIQRIRIMPHISRQKRRTNRLPINPIAISFRRAEWRA